MQQVHRGSVSSDCQHERSAHVCCLCASTKESQDAVCGCAGHVMVVDGAAWMWREQAVSREQVSTVSRGIEARSRQIGTAAAPRSKM